MIFTKNNARGKASLTPGTRSLQRQQAVARKLATKSQKAQRGGVLPLHERPSSPCSVILEADMETVGQTALKGARVALHGAKVAGGYGISTARVAGSYSLIASKALYAMAATLWASLAVACAVVVGGMCFLVSTLFEMSRPVWKSTGVSGAPDNSSLSHFSAMTWPRWLRRAVGNRHRHAIEQSR